MATIDASRLEALRRGRDQSQRALAEAAGITRQAVSAIESGRMQPSVGIALRLARALDTTVEDLFSAPGEPAAAPTRIASASIGGRAVSRALDQDHLAVEPAESAVPTIFVGGCDPSAGLLSREATGRSRDLRVLWFTMTNPAAIEALARGELHAAVIHEAPVPRTRPTADVVRFEIATTEAGWLVAHGNPLALRGASDLDRKKARLANRPAGAGARRLLDEQLRRAAVDPTRLAGYDRELNGQLDAGRAVAQGFADAAVGMASVARIFGLDFLPLRSERCVLLVPAPAVRTPEIRALLDALRSTPYRRDLDALQAYDTTRTGKRTA
jgi:molybdate-binding protein/DNA-binding XRE family transcriptional regulator